MDETENSINLLKNAITFVLHKVDGKVPIKDLEKIFFETYGNIDLQDFGGATDMIEFLKKFPNIFLISDENFQLWVSLLKSSDTSPCLPTASLNFQNIKRLKRDGSSYVMYNYFADIAACKLRNKKKPMEPCKSDRVETSQTMDNVTTTATTLSLNIIRDQNQDWHINNPFLEDITTTDNQKGPTDISEINQFKEHRDQETDNGQDEKDNVSQWAKSWKEIVTHPQMNPPLSDSDAIDDYEILRESDTSDDEYQTSQNKKTLYEKSISSQSSSTQQESQYYNERFNLLNASKVNFKSYNSHVQDEIQDEPQEVYLDRIFDLLEEVREQQCMQNVLNREFSNSVEDLSRKSSVAVKNKSSLCISNSFDEENISHGPHETEMAFDDKINYLYYPKHNRDPEFVMPKKYEIEKNFRSLKINLSETNSPTHFWFHTEFSLKIKMNLEREIAKAYNSDDDDFLQISIESLKKGLIILAYHPFLKNWYRAQVVKICGNRCLLFYFDYGTTDYNSIDNLKYLMTEFLDFPPLCYRGRIYGVAPINERRFTVTQQDRFICDVDGLKFSGDCIYYDETQDVYELKLKLIGKHDKIYDDDIKEWLLNEKICKVIPSLILNNRGEAKNPIYYEIPSFYLLERGIYPSFETLAICEEKLNDPYKLIEKSIRDSKEASLEILDMLKDIK